MARLVYLLAGQSNMAGRGYLSDLPAAAAAAAAGDVVLFHQTRDDFILAQHPLHADKPDKAGVGPALAFAEELMRSGYAPAIGGGIALVPCAWGGSPLERWEEGGDLSSEAVRRTKAALEALKPKDGGGGGGGGGGDGGTLAGILWHQGESDCAEPESASSYGSRLARALASLRDALGDPHLPIVTAELGYFLPELALDDERFRYCAGVNAAIRRTCAEDGLEKCACVSARGLEHRGDRLHFDANSQVELGRRLGKAWLALVQAPGSEEQCREEDGQTTVEESFCFPTSATSTNHAKDGDCVNTESEKAHQAAAMD